MFHSLLRRLPNKQWVVYAKPPFGGPEHVLKYLARYTPRVAIANGRLLSLTDGQVRFRWRFQPEASYCPSPLMRSHTL